MKSFNKRGCYRFGGTIKTKSVHGVKTGNHNNPNSVRAAERYGEDVDGDKPKMRMDRPMRSGGGRVKREDGGEVIGSKRGWAVPDPIPNELDQASRDHDAQAKAVIAEQRKAAARGIDKAMNDGIAARDAAAFGGFRKSGGRVGKGAK